ncbi:MAG: 3-hydroxyacyl-CoA dehydrogenase/enoyl-CoA hydratase family protein [Candidatus Krumholzibacteria bacterium]|nr:3-hydroxyacyl-CoA dehydrogenase/enoyl-CoA hydratase family protein [Candidatus Krumholzibacteria bacterium]
MFVFKGRRINRVAVVGSGQIGPDIALHFTKVFAPLGVPVVVVDIAAEALASGRARMDAKIDKGVERGAFTPEGAAAMKDNVTFTENYDALRGASLVVEAASEDHAVKAKVFARLEERCPEALLASNSSHMEPEVIFAGARRRDRSLVIHYFFPAERNPIVEVVPGRETDPARVAWTMALYQWMGKIPIRVRSRYGYAVDPIFEGLFLAAALCVEEGLGTVKEVDAVARQALGMGVGPFTAMNLTGGNPITQHGLGHLHDKVMPWFSSPRILDEAIAAGKPWETAKRDETVEVDDDRRDQITARMRGAYFGLVTEVLESGITNVSDLELALETALVVRAPFRMMSEVGVRESLALVEAYAAAHPGFKVPRPLVAQAEQNAPWKVPVILREDRAGVAVVTIRRPAVLNAMNAEAIAQLGEVFAEIGKDPSVRAAVLTGYGSKAFVSGADIGYLSRLGTPEAAEHMCTTFQGSIQVIEDLPKPVVCALNGLALGGGCEIAMGCHARVAHKGVKLGQPEVALGIIPGAGGTQRLPRIVGFEVGAELLRTGKPIRAERALEIGLVDRLSDDDVVADAIALAGEILEGRYQPKRMASGPVSVPASLPDVDIGHLSRAVDEILCRAVLGGGRLTLEDGLRHEAKRFAEVSQTEDAKIGLRNFIEKGPRSKAPFVHR